MAEKRVFVDCRAFPSEKNCSLYIAGTEDEVLTVAVRHAVNEHGHQETPELRKQIRELIKTEPAGR
jgi:predicted small metal-binding protein